MAGQHILDTVTNKGLETFFQKGEKEIKRSFFHLKGETVDKGNASHLFFLILFKFIDPHYERNFFSTMSFLGKFIYMKSERCELIETLDLVDE
jgi:hypothetical protein